MRNLAKLVIILGIVGLVIGIVFIAQGMLKENWMVEAMQLEKVTFGLEESAMARGEVINSAGEAQLAGDLIREHRRNIAPTYQDLLAGGRFDPANLSHLNYAQALNMENYLYLAVLGFGVTTMVIASGAFMIITGIALCATGAVLHRLSGREP